MRLVNYGLAVLVITFGLHTTLSAAETEATDPEFLEFLSMVMLSPQEDAREKLAEFAQRLHIRADQKAVWQAFEDYTVQDITKKADRKRQRWQQIKQRENPITTMEMIDAHIEFLNQQIVEAGEKKRIIGDLVATMNESQRAYFDRAIRLVMFKRLQRLKN